ncbi:unnamed protein product [Brassica oleracea var. botrytis]
MKPTHQIYLTLDFFILKRITNLKPGEEREDPERRYVK